MEVVLIFPTMIRLFNRSTTTLQRANITSNVLIRRCLTTYFFCNFRRALIKNANGTLVTLTVIINTCIRSNVIFTIMPTSMFYFDLRRKGRITTLFTRNLPLFGLYWGPTSKSSNVNFRRLRKENNIRLKQSSTNRMIFYQRLISNNGLSFISRRARNTRRNLYFLTFPIRVSASNCIFR